MNNLSARLVVNDWVVKQDRGPIPASLSYQEFATELRRLYAPKEHHVDFVSREDAVAYVRYVASQVLTE